MVFASLNNLKRMMDKNILFEVIIMPLPLGHAAIGFAAHSVISKEIGPINKWKLAVFIVILSNLPDIDVLIGLVLQNNGSVFHRGPTHSIVFALLMGFVASKLSEIWRRIPAVSFKVCFALVLSHVVADYFLTNSPVSFFWPFEVSWSTGNAGWGEVFNTVLFGAAKETGIFICCTAVILLAMIFKKVHYAGKLRQLTSVKKPKSDLHV